MKIATRILLVAALGLSSLTPAAESGLFFQSVDREVTYTLPDTKLIEDSCTLRHGVVSVDYESLFNYADFALGHSNLADLDPLSLELFAGLVIDVRITSIRTSSEYGLLIRVIHFQGIEQGADDSLPIEYGVSGDLSTADTQISRGSFSTLSWTIGLRPTDEPNLLLVYEYDTKSEQCIRGM